MNRAQPGWWGRNWKWAAPGGCLLVVMLAFGGCVAIAAGVFGLMKNNEVYAGALAQAQASAAVQEAIGTPVEAGWMVSGHIDQSGDRGDAELTIPVSGPRGAGTIFVEAENAGAGWTYQVLTFVPANGDPVDLLAEGR